MNLEKNFWVNKKVLITGHTGFKGSWLSLWLLKNGADVYGYSLPVNDEMILYNSLKLDNLNKSGSNLFKSYEGDILDKNFLKEKFKEIQPDIIFHLAAQSLVRKGYLDPETTWKTNVIGTINILESLKVLDKKCSVIMVTTDKVYKNKEWIYGYREIDELGGKDPYSASKSCMEIAISSWIDSFGEAFPNIKISVARSGNVIGGGDFAKDRIIPDVVKSLIDKKKILVRNPLSTRPWQHVLEPLFGYMLLAEKSYQFIGKQKAPNNYLASSFNFGPDSTRNKSVKDLVEEVLKYWPGSWDDVSNQLNPKESNLLKLNSDKAAEILGWKCIWDFKKTIKITIEWYKNFLNGKKCIDCCISDIEEFLIDSKWKQN